MTGLSHELKTALLDVLGASPTTVVPASGGMISRAARIETAKGRFFLKWGEGETPPGFFTAEADGLRRLQAAKALRVPDVIAVQDSDAEQTTAFLVLEYIVPHVPSNPTRFAQRFGEALATLHRENTPSFGAFGLDLDNYIGILMQRNSPHKSWSEFYREYRILPQMEMARERGRLPAGREKLLMQVVEKLDTLLEGLDSHPALLHGDLWSGNFLAAGEEPVVFDPSVYYGEREMELAYMELFGGFPAALFTAYRAAYPLHPGYERRRPLHQLYPLLSHVNHFGEPYGQRVEEVCRQLLR